ncbi:hypothetical protein Csa_006090 [Cucumis sativus]|nr:hypothetical protein Csa_006090 [Cucumis sativus]
MLDATKTTIKYFKANPIYHDLKFNSNQSITITAMELKVKVHNQIAFEQSDKNEETDEAKPKLFTKNSYKRKTYTKSRKA